MAGDEEKEVEEEEGDGMEVSLVEEVCIFNLCMGRRGCVVGTR